MWQWFEYFSAFAVMGLVAVIFGYSVGRLISLIIDKIIQFRKTHRKDKHQ